MSATSSGLKSKLRETLKQEDAALAERSRAVAKPAASISRWRIRRPARRP